MKLSEIHIYPIKSLAGISLQTAKVEAQGLQYDRRWMLTNKEGKFLSQREFPAMAQMQTAINETYLSVFWKNNPAERIDIPLNCEDVPSLQVPVEVWGTHFEAVRLPHLYSEWFSDQLQSKMFLTFMNAKSFRPTNPERAPGFEVSFADGYPFLIIGQAALDALNARLDTALPMNRFRPNFVFTGGNAHDEDNFRDFTIGNVPFRGVKPCGRCIMTTINQDTIEKLPEPIRTLAKYRFQEKNINFGENLVFTGDGLNEQINVGDVLKILTTKH
jgi:uncharacterized protein